MLGSTIIFEKDSSRLFDLEVDDLEDLTCVEMDRLTTIDFESLAERGNVSWASDAPLRFEEDTGLVLFKVSPDGLKHAVSVTKGLSREKLADLRKLEAFLEQHGFDHIYEFATF